MILEYIVKDNKYENINQILKQEFHISARLQQKLIKQSHVFQNGSSVDTRNSVNINDVITVDLDFEEESENIVSTQMDLNIVFDDDGLPISSHENQKIHGYGMKSIKLITETYGGNININVDNNKFKI